MIESFDESIGLQTSHMNRRMLRFLNHSLEWYDITLEQWVVLSKLAEEEEITQKMLSVKTEKDPASILRILDILEKKELIERRQNAGDRRASSLYITARGRALKDEVIPYIENRFKEIVEGISEQEITTYLKVLHRIDLNLVDLLNKQKG
ncbi:MarR family winged helix-turn-helix transcriptional regulator [Clostridium oryzae]|uniref:Transcriptional regulator SlyA n=1 Tax=Clostridium oryzae TaxID=1450648 RepID=A0A1V4IQH5_9CLOT|nr:MarR family transcriptional regulator [Clostridium oryzae]OPJ62252.1 transcriptional regulator SlyA [Clostridium oryzae]